MPKRYDRSLVWARNGAVVALAVSIAALLLPSSLSGYNDWSDWHLALHNVAAILTRIVVVAGIAAALGAVWNDRRHGHIR